MCVCVCVCLFYVWLGEDDGVRSTLSCNMTSLDWSTDVHISQFIERKEEENKKDCGKKINRIRVSCERQE